VKAIIYDVEVFRYDFLVVFKDYSTKEYTVIWNDNDLVKACIQDDALYIGFNNKFYDQYIVKAICMGLMPDEVKQINDYLISGQGHGWECPRLQEFYFKMANADVRDDMQQGLSLKAIEGHLGMNIQETTVPFDIDRPLTPQERSEVEFYCKHDVDTTDRVFNLRKGYFRSKVDVGRMAGIDAFRAMGMTNAKLTVALLKATPCPHNDERDYLYPDNLKMEVIPKEVLHFFDRMNDTSLSDTEVFSGKLNLSIGECPVTLGYGGIHGAIPNYFWSEDPQSERVIRNYDVSSYYPHLMTINGYTSRNIPSPKVFAEVLEKRMKAKAAGDKATANALKLVVNTTYGACLNKYNALYDPLMGRSVCISGQLYLLELALTLYQNIQALKIVQLNTDGIMVEFDMTHYDCVKGCVSEWEHRTGFEMEEDSVSKIAQKDVNNYVEVQHNGTIKTKGGYLVRGIAPAGAFNINNNARIVAKALTDYFASGKPVEDTITECNDIIEFQLIAKAGAKYSDAYHVMDGGRHVPIQRVNRVYATPDRNLGTLYKVKAENNSIAKIENLPEHCIIDNNNELTISDIDKTYYIDLAKKRVNDFKGILPERKNTKRMATTTTTKNRTTKPKNVYQKLIMARQRFLENGIKKSGKNMQIQYTYFELDDIVPIVTKIFSEIGLIALVTYGDEYATMTVVNTDSPDEIIMFTSPMRYPSENRAVNPVQALGAAQTYLRRYLYMMALDICEPDTIEQTTEPDKPKAPKTPKAPVTTQERSKIKMDLTSPKDPATKLQIKQLKAALKKLKDSQPDKEEMITKLALDTKGFTEISKTDCENLLKSIAGMLEAK